jgi:hypothetical protein
MTECPYCHQIGAYNTGMRVECRNPSCKHYSKKWAEDPAFGGTGAVGGQRSAAGALALPEGIYPKQAAPLTSISGEKLIVPEERVPAPGNGRRILATPLWKIAPGTTERVVVRPQMDVWIEEVLIVATPLHEQSTESVRTIIPEALLYLTDFRIGYDSRFETSDSPMRSDLLAKAPLRIDRPARCSVDLLFCITNPTYSPVTAQGICLLTPEKSTSYEDTDTAFEKGKAVREERERIARMVEEYGQTRIPTAETWWKRIVIAIRRGSTTLSV